MKFDSKVVIVTGAPAELAKRQSDFCKRGAKVVIADYSDRGQAVSDELRGAGLEALFVKTDVTQEQEVANMVNQTVQHFGRVDILFANAGIAHDAPADQLAMDNWQRTIDINLTGSSCAINMLFSKCCPKEPEGRS